ncbi:hypothetical protein BH10CHL1_BH10CHL1_11960 [soil metagenome]
MRIAQWGNAMYNAAQSATQNAFRLLFYAIQVRFHGLHYATKNFHAAQSRP